MHNTQYIPTKFALDTFLSHRDTENQPCQIGAKQSIAGDTVIVRHIKLILVLAGLGTLPAALLFFFPALLSLLLHVDIAGDAALVFARHWGLEVGCMGALLLYAAHEAKVRTAVLSAAVVGKAGIVYLLVSQLGNASLAGLSPIIGFDSLCVLLFALYLFQAPHRAA
jgi:hypothetical protein